MTHVPPPLLETRLGQLLGGGTWLACAVMAVGLCARLLHFETIGDHITTIGVGLIIALPVLRLATMLEYFFRQGQRSDRQQRTALEDRPMKQALAGR